MIEVKSNWQDDELRIEFMLGNTCNFKCWYCFKGSNEGTHRWEDYDVIVKNLTHLVRHYKANGKKRIYLHIVGGEPTLWPKLGDFARIFSAENCIISMSTNGSRTLRWWREHSKYFSKIILSCHPNEVDITHNIQVADIIYESKCIVDASVLMDPTCWDKCLEIVEQLKTSKHRWSIIASHVIHDTIFYTQEQKNYFNDYIKRVPNIWYYIRNNKYHEDKIKVVLDDLKVKNINPNWIAINKLNHFKGWECNIGVDSLFIDKFGTISGTCSQNLYGNNFNYNLYADDFLDQFKPKLKPVICDKENCFCQPEINLRKRIIPILKI